ncbi:hypothetical protein HYPSUDRAFT_202262 [Hypholoma sublateritium FD-334 SS-4]|uniref:Uncharacterized protein n=1 Tax=Hypholoma sublateritium (strain FD-334 SS-4) TaxID=945553 RepID=A0A0D2NTR6_HYPSF|nr:hypothetical protein HYPSUDRAFT_202262 [Hypholoma sublateritium FD-334 SS-4]
MTPAASSASESLSRPRRADGRRGRATSGSTNQPLPVRWDKIAARMVYNLVHKTRTIANVFFELLEFVPTIHCGRPGAAYLVEAVFNALLVVDAAIAMEYLECMAELSLIKFYGFWSVKFSGASNTLYTLDHDIGTSRCAYIGALVANGYICYGRYKEMVLYLLDGFRDREDIRCVTTLVQNTATGETHHKDIPFIMECLSRLRKRAHELFGDAVESEEETELSTLLHSMLLGRDNESLPWALTYLPVVTDRRG